MQAHLKTAHIMSTSIPLANAGHMAKPKNYCLEKYILPTSEKYHKITWQKTCMCNGFTLSSLPCTLTPWLLNAVLMMLPWPPRWERDDTIPYSCLCLGFPICRGTDDEPPGPLRL